MMIFHATAICGGDDSYANKYNNDDNEGHDHDDIKGEEDKEDEENDEDDHVSNPPLPHDLSNNSRSTHPSSTPYARYQGLRRTHRRIGFPLYRLAAPSPSLRRARTHRATLLGHLEDPVVRLE